MSGVMATIPLNSYTYCLQDRYFLIKFDNFGDAIHEIFPNASCTPMHFFVKENLVNWYPKTHGPRNYLQSFYLDALIHKFWGKKQYPYAEIRNLLQAEGQDHYRKKVITMELLRCLLMINSHPYIRKVMGKILMVIAVD